MQNRTRHAQVLRRLRDFLGNAADGREELWKVWWLAGIPLGWTTSALIVAAECLRTNGYHAWGDAFDVARFLAFFAWARMAWRCSRNCAQPFWTHAARALLAGGLFCMAMI
jgi:hypothetical protein